MAKCGRCKLIKPLEDFHKGRNSGGVASWCKACSSARRGRHNPHKWREYKYGVTFEQYSHMLESQGGVCAICKQVPADVQNGKVLSLSVDHNHETGEVRGLLCKRCNQGIGLLQDSPEYLRQAADYLEGV